ncbi:MAG TPA: helix-turn-helix transcriptional regulator [Pseudonocardiaceae bacterium]|nr:helix-turn-helix transcriptional regulator [Pseudonocardiaceae bacterium]
MSRPARRPDELSTTLRRLRSAAGLSGMEAARRAGYSQPKISRFETARQVPTIEEVHVLCGVYGAPPEVRDRLLELAADLTAGTIRSRAVLSHGARYMQQRFGRIEQASELVRSFTPTIVDGLLQTPDYVRAMGSHRLAGEALESFVASRADRQRILDTDRQFQSIITEGALHWHVGSPQIMAAQLEHLIEASHRPNLRLGVIPWTTPVHSPALHCFTIFDDRAVIVGTETATAIITDPADIADYDQRHTLYSQLTVVGDPARAVLARLAGEYRDLA